jgi:hypothetical protein
MHDDQKKPSGLLAEQDEALLGHAGCLIRVDASERIVERGESLLERYTMSTEVCGSFRGIPLEA